MKNDSNIEYERKFLVNHDYLDTAKASAVNILEIKQTYITFSPEVRIRETKHQNSKRIYHTMTIKKKLDSGRYEKEIKIRKSSYLDLYKNKEGIDIYKTRYIIPIEKSGLIAELDIYKDFELVLVEVEFKNVEDMKKFIRPYWFGADVTGSQCYKIKSLAKNGI